MSDLMAVVNARATDLGVPLSVHLDLTYRCNERCVHCYLDHDDRGELTTEEVRSVLRQLAEAGTLFLTLSGGEALLRADFFDLLRYARELRFCVRVKTNGVLIRDREADLMRELGVQQVQISLYSHRAEIHDGITKLPGSFDRSIDAIRRLTARGMPVVIANVLMKRNFADYPGLRALAEQLGAECTIDPTVTPHITGDRGVVALGVDGDQLRAAFNDEALVGDDEFCAVPGSAHGDDVLDALPCSAGHSACYVSPYGDVYPCVQFPLPTGNIRAQPFLDIWRHSTAFKDVRSIRVRDLTTCSSCAHAGACTRCPGLAYMEGSMRGPSSLDCAKSFARTGVETAGMAAGHSASVPTTFIPIDRLLHASPARRV